MRIRNVRTIGMVLAGGKGTRLHPLTWKRTKPAVPFGSKYRIIDFALNNMINSGIYGIFVLTQFKAQSLTEHIQRNWRFGSFLADYFITLAPAQMYLYEELGAEWYRGTADAIYQNLHLIKNHSADLVAIFSGDHIYKMDISHMIEYHLDSEADVTIAANPTPVAEASRFGVLRVDADFRITEFQEKPANPKSIPGRDSHALASMGNYIFSTNALAELLNKDAADPDSAHDFGNDVLPRALGEGYNLKAYDFARNPIPGQEGENTYWRGCWNARQLPRGEHGSGGGETGIRPLQRSVAAAHIGRVLPASQVRSRNRRPARPGPQQPGCRRGYRLRWDGAGFGAVPAGPRQLLLSGRALGPVRRCAGPL